VVTVHDLIPLTFYSRRHRLPARQRLFYRWNLGALQRAARAIVVSESSRREVLAHLPISPERVVTVLNGLDRPAEEGSPSGSRHVLCVASFEPRKNLPLLVRAYARAVEGGLSLPLVIVAEPGSGDERPVREALDWPALRDRLELRHHLSDDELSRLYREAAFVVCPSLAEGFGLPPLEAMAHGTAVIASDIPAHRELLGDAALFFPPEDGEALAQSLLRLAGNARLRERLVRSGREQAGLYSWERCAAETVAVYLEVVREATEGRARAARSLTRGREG
jgi:glycosyltransferase involved in cell wall biosynthesis